MLRTLQFIARGLRERKVPHRSRAWIEAIQTERLRKLIAVASQQSPFYAERLRGVDPERFTLADLPTVTKTELMGSFDQVVTDRTLRRGDVEEFLSDPARLGQWYRGKYAVCRTSGTQGEPALIVHDRSMIDLHYLIQMARCTVLRSDPLSLVSHVVNPNRMAAITAGRSFGPSAFTLAYAPAASRWFVKHRWFPQIEPLDEVVAQLNEYQPHILLAYAGVHETLAREALAGRLRLTHLCQVSNISEPLSAIARRSIGEAFRVPVLDFYAAGECLALSAGCKEGHGIHLNADWAILEVVDRQGQPVAPGQPGEKVFLTNLYNTVQPFIRYEIPDVVTMSPTPCPCGNPMPLILRVEGRTEDTVWIADAERFRRLDPYIFLDILNLHPALGPYQVIQQQRNAFLLRAAPAQGRSLSREELIRSMRAGLQQYQLDRLIEFDVEIVPSLPADPRSGKLKRIISRVGPPASK